MAAKKKPANESAAQNANEKPKRLFLIDGYSNIFRAFYAIRELSNSKGEPTNAVYGFVNMLRKLLRDEQPDLIGIGMDTSGATLRKEKFEEYKANRRPMPDDLRSQMPLIRRAIDAMKIPMLEAEGYEADDVLGTLAKKAAAAGYDVVLVTADKDFFQLVDDHVSVYHSFREKLYDAALVEEDFGVPPHQVVDVLALMGDSIDNVPGVPGIGEKGAKNLIKEHGSLEALLDAAPDIKRKNYREGLTDHRNEALLSQELVTIETELDVPFEPDRLELEPPDRDALLELYRELDFFSLLKEMEADVAGAALDDLEAAADVDSAERWNEVAGGLGAELVLALVGPVDQPRGVAVLDQTEGSDAYFADFARDGVREAVSATLAQWLAADDATLVGHDLKEMLRLVARSGADLEVGARLRDTMLLAYLLAFAPAAAAQSAPPPLTKTASAPVMTLAKLLAQMAKMPGLSARFVERKHMKLLVKPLVAKGTLYFTPPGYLARHVESPKPAKLLITPKHLEVRQGGGKQIIDLSARRDVKLFVESFARLLAGDRKALDAIYKLKFTSKGLLWTLELAPKAATLAKLVKKLTIKGKGHAVLSIRVDETAGDWSITEITQADPKRKFEGAERKRIFGF